MFNQWLLLYITQKTPLYSAVKKENLEIIKLLIESKGIDVNAKTVITKHYRDCINEYKKRVSVFY